MKKLCVAALMILCSVSVIYSEELINQDKNIHEIIGGLYSLAAAVKLNNNPAPEINTLRRYFTSDPENVKISRKNNAVWVGVSVGKYSPARSFLRSNAQTLGITDSPDGYAWMSGEFAWIKADDVKLKAARGSGTDSGIIFFSTPEQNSWWQAKPSFTQQSVQIVLKRWGVNDAPELYAPAGISRTSIYESVKPLPVSKPSKMHVGGKTSDDMSIEVGDVLFNPIPNVGQRY